MANDGSKKVSTTRLTKFIITIPHTQKSLFLMIFLSVITGIGSEFILLSELVVIEKILFGSMKGFLIIGLPAIFSAVITTSLADALHTELKLHRSMFLSLFSSLIFSIIYIVGSFFYGSPYFLSDFVIMGNGVIMGFRILVLVAASRSNFLKAIPLSLTQPIISVLLFFALVSIEGIGNLITPMVGPEVSLLILGIKLLLSSSIFLFAVYSFIVIIDAPMRRNFGIGTLELFKMFLAHWTDKSLGLEALFTDMGDNVDTPLSVIAFKGRKGMKGIFVIPALHPGPFGDIGGANMPTVISRHLHKKYGGTTMVFHGASSHEMNLVSKKELNQVVRAADTAVRNLKFSNVLSSPLEREKVDDSKMSVQIFGDAAVLFSTFSPFPTEDVDWGIGLAVENHVSGFKGTFVDAHNCHKSSAQYIYDGNPVVFSMMSAVDRAVGKAKRVRKKGLKIGFGYKVLDFSRDRGIGDDGIKVCITEVGNKRSCIVLFDANNLVLGLREKVIKYVKDRGIYQCEVCTSDTHTVNAIRGVSNPFGRAFSAEFVLEQVGECLDMALMDLEPVTVASGRTILRNVRVFGALHPTEFMSTVNSIVATAKIIAPGVVGVSLLLVLMGLILL